MSKALFINPLSVSRPGKKQHFSRDYQAKTKKKTNHETWSYNKLLQA
jgi:hypothetical protein